MLEIEYEGDENAGEQKLYFFENKKLKSMLSWNSWGIHVAIETRTYLVTFFEAECFEAMLICKCWDIHVALETRTWLVMQEHFVLFFFSDRWSLIFALTDRPGSSIMHRQEDALDEEAEEFIGMID